MLFSVTIFFEQSLGDTLKLLCQSFNCHFSIVTNLDTLQSSLSILVACIDHSVKLFTCDVTSSCVPVQPVRMHPWGLITSLWLLALFQQSTPTFRVSSFLHKFLPYGQTHNLWMTRDKHLQIFTRNCQSGGAGVGGVGGSEVLHIPPLLKLVQNFKYRAYGTKEKQDSRETIVINNRTICAPKWADVCSQCAVLSNCDILKIQQSSKTVLVISTFLSWSAAHIQDQIHLEGKLLNYFWISLVHRLSSKCTCAWSSFNTELRLQTAIQNIATAVTYWNENLNWNSRSAHFSHSLYISVEIMFFLSCHCLFGKGEVSHDQMFPKYVGVDKNDFWGKKNAD